MIIPSVDIMNGETVQLVGGKTLKLTAGHPLEHTRNFGMVGEVAVVDLDAALGKGNNRELIIPLLKEAEVRMGGGIRSAEAAIEWLDLGAAKVVLGTAATPEVLSKLPPERVIAALDAYQGEVVVDGWMTKTGRSIEEQMQLLAPYVSEFLVTFVEREGRMVGVDLDRIKRVRDAAQGRKLTMAGGISTAKDVALVDELGVDAQVGMALYTGVFDVADALGAMMRSDRPDGLWTTVVVDRGGVALGLVYSDLESLKLALAERRGIYKSRTRGIWRKGETSGAMQTLHSVRLDCDRDALLFVVDQAEPGFCHKNTYTCWQERTGILALEQTLRARKTNPVQGSYANRLFNNPSLLASKLTEEASELAEAITDEEVKQEAADVLYFTMVKLAERGLSIRDVEHVLDLRSRKLTRRPGDAKPALAPTTKSTT